MRPGRLKDLIGWGAARPDYAAGLRAATATILPLAIGEATGRHQLIWVALGGWLAIFTDPGGPYPLRARTMASFAFTGAVSLAAGCAVAGHPWPSVAVLFIWATGCSLLRVYGEAPGSVGTLSLITFCIGLGSPATGSQVLALRSGLFAAGALWAAALCVALWPVHPYRPVRRAVAACHRALAGHVRSLATGAAGWFDAAARGRGAIRVQLEATRAIVGSVRGGRSGESRRGNLLVAVYEAAELALGDLSAVAETLQSLADRGEARPAWADPALERAASAFDAVAQAAGEEKVAVARPDLRASETANWPGRCARSLRTSCSRRRPRPPCRARRPPIRCRASSCGRPGGARSATCSRSARSNCAMPSAWRPPRRPRPCSASSSSSRAATGSSSPP